MGDEKVGAALWGKARIAYRSPNGSCITTRIVLGDKLSQSAARNGALNITNLAAAVDDAAGKSLRFGEALRQSAGD
jgi:hypothetical protein